MTDLSINKDNKEEDINHQSHTALVITAPECLRRFGSIVGFPLKMPNLGTKFADFVKSVVLFHSSNTC